MDNVKLSHDFAQPTSDALLDGSGIASEGHGHLQPLGRDVTDGRLDVVGNPPRCGKGE